MVESLPTMVDMHIKEQVKKQVPEQVRDQVPVYVAEGLILERQKTKEEMERMIAKAILQERGNIQAEISSQIQKAIDNQIHSQVDASQQDIAIWLALQMKFENLQVQQTTCRPYAVHPRDQDDPHDDVHLEGENSAKRQKTSEYFNPLNAKIFYIWKQKESGKPKEEVYSNSKIIQVIKTYWELGHEHKFVTEIVARRANECIVLITEPDYKNLNKNDIEDMYLNYEWQGKKEKRVMRHSEIHKFCDATLNRVLEGLKSYNNDVKYGYVQRELTNDEVEYLKLFEEEIEVRLKHRNQMRRWEMYVNGRPLGPRRERPE
ncbi:hypothetical protein Tco_1112324 [Tanacetum coccineum]|uniref:Uncharacterized protein n=1 Tax=Tanacetum coccineum TaxID=301880 RepID=A0ABQ5IQA7_9ASTR